MIDDLNIGKSLEKNIITTYMKHLYEYTRESLNNIHNISGFLKVYK